MSQRERDVLKAMSLVISGQRSQAEAAVLVGRSVRQVRRILSRLRAEGDVGVVHKLRGRPSNNQSDPLVRTRAIELCRKRYTGFGPTLVVEKLAADDIVLSPETLRGWMMSEGLWERKRHREKHRQRRVRRSCFGEMVQADASLHDWLEGRGPMLALVGMIDDATGRLVCRFHESETTFAYMDVLGRWMRKFGRPVSWYSDRHGIFRAEEAVSGYDEKRSVATQFSRAIGELGMELILANSPQAKGRVERVWGTAQDRLVKELRLAGARTIDEANAVLEQTFLQWFNRRCTHKPASANDVHRGIDGLDLQVILSLQEERVVANDYTIRFDNRVYQLLPPAWPGQRGSKVIVETRADGTIKMRFKGRYLPFKPAASEAQDKALNVESGALPPVPRSLALQPIPVIVLPKANDPIASAIGPITVHRTDGRSGRTPALPCPPGGTNRGRPKAPWRPAPAHPRCKAAIG